MALFCSFFYGWLIFHCIYVPLLISVLTSRNIINLSFKRKTVWNKKLFHNIVLLLIPLGFYSYALDSIHIASTICRSFSNKYTRSFHFWIKWALIIEIYIFQSQKIIKSEKYGGRGGKKEKQVYFFYFFTASVSVFALAGSLGLTIYFPSFQSRLLQSLGHKPILIPSRTPWAPGHKDFLCPPSLSL